ncbi:MAG TPA: HU family DNA-binding protein [SAR86 cluster bacterium]|nr:HU family DNA-binding protein [SAR86 cluster bacterium]HJM15279.1 HU family DNA-binding protein [SAR86 cluster bacterium]
MNKAQLTDAVAAATDSSKAEAGRAVEATLSAIGSALAGGDSVSLVGFGTFNVRHRAARMGRNPQTGASIQIQASKSVGFKAGKALKESL